MENCAPWSYRGIASIVWISGIIVIGIANPGASQPVHGQKQYHLALGDSITLGNQAYRQEAGLPPSAFNTGYVDVLAAHLREIQPGITVVNYGCPGESTRSSDIP